MKKAILFLIVIGMMIPTISSAYEFSAYACYADKNVSALFQERAYLINKLEREIEDIKETSSMYPHAKGLNVKSFQSQAFEEAVSGLKNTVDRIRFIMQQLDNASYL